MKTYTASDVAMMRLAALDEGFEEGKILRDALVEALGNLVWQIDHERAKGTNDHLRTEEAREVLKQARGES